MHDFRYNETAYALEENLEDVLESHQAEREKEAAEEKQQLSTEPPALDRIVGGHLARDEVDKVIANAKATSKSASDLILEHRLAQRMRKLAGRGRSTVNEFLTSVRG